MHHLTPFKPVSEQNPYPPQHKLPILSTKPLSSAQTPILSQKLYPRHKTLYPRHKTPYPQHKTPILNTKSLSLAQNPYPLHKTPFPQHKTLILCTKPLSSAQKPLILVCTLNNSPLLDADCLSLQCITSSNIKFKLLRCITLYIKFRLAFIPPLKSPYLGL